MEMKWYIDSWSPTEGVVFASNRVSSNDPWDVDLVQTIMMAAPYFEPQNVSRAIAFGAAQRGFQEQFSVQGEQETGFPTLDQLALFVRRTYTGSGSSPEGDGGDDGGNGGDGGNGSDGGERERARARMRRRRQERMRGDRPRGDWQSLNEFGDARKIGSLLSECQTLSFEDRVKGILALVRQEEKRYLEDARTILIESAHELNVPEPSQAEYRLRAIADLLIFDADERYPRYHLHEVNTLSLALMAPLSKSYAGFVGLPLKIRTMRDALGFLAADRHFLSERLISRMLPLLLAIAANFCSSRATANWYSYRKGYRELFIQECCEFILRWLPFDPLPDSIEGVVSDWSNLTAAAQRRV